MRASAASRTARSTRTTANGATTTARFRTKARSSSSISASSTWPPKLGPKSRSAPTWKRSFPCSSTGNNKTRGRGSCAGRLPRVFVPGCCESSPIWKPSDRRRTGENRLKADVLAAVELAEGQQGDDGQAGHDGGQCSCGAVVAADDLGVDGHRLLMEHCSNGAGLYLINTQHYF